MTSMAPEIAKGSGGLSACRMTAAVLGVLIGTSGINHGFFEALQGWKTTNGFVIQAIGEAQRMWPGGTEEAFTLVPNYLITGVLAMCTGLAIIVWSVRFTQRRYGTSILLVLFIVLFLVGGGIGQVLFFIPAWAYAARIDKPARWRERVLSGRGGKLLSPIWKYCLALCSFLFLVALEIAIFGFFPGITNPETLLYTCWIFLAASWVLMNASFIASFAADIARRTQQADTRSA